MTTNDPEFKGIYGIYKITQKDRKEVQFYRFSLLSCAIAFSLGISQWIIWGPDKAWIWIIPMAISLGLALRWIHIYLRALHNLLQIFWAIGCLGITILIYNLGGGNMLSAFVEKPIWVLAIGPFFASLTGVGFKEFFCFQRAEAIGLTIIIPIALLGYLSSIFNGGTTMTLLGLSALLLLLLSLRKFGMDAADDVGDKSVFEYLSSQKI